MQYKIMAINNTHPTSHRTQVLGVLTRVYTYLANQITVMQLVTTITNLLTPLQAACVFKWVRQSDELWVIFTRMTTFSSIVWSDMWSYMQVVCLMNMLHCVPSRSNYYCKHLLSHIYFARDSAIKSGSYSQDLRYCDSASKNGHTARAWQDMKPFSSLHFLVLNTSRSFKFILV